MFAHAHPAQDLKGEDGMGLLAGFALKPAKYGHFDQIFAIFKTIHWAPQMTSKSVGKSLRPGIRNLPPLSKAPRGHWQIVVFEAPSCVDIERSKEIFTLKTPPPPARIGEIGLHFLIPTSLSNTQQPFSRCFEGFPKIEGPSVQS